MKIYLTVFVITLIAACNVDDNSNDTSPIIVANAIAYNNNLPVDGCAERISLINAKGEEIKILLPTEASKPLFVNLLNIEIAKLPKDTYSGNLNIPVMLKYRETQRKAELVCGWNKKSMVEEVEIISISKQWKNYF